MFSANDVEVGSFSKYQSAGVSEKVVITDVVINKNIEYGTTSLSLKTINENEQEGQSKKLSLKTEVSPGKTVAAWTVTARYLINVLMSVGNTEDQAKAILEANDEESLAKNLRKALIGKPFRGLFSSREYNPGKFAIELYITEPVGGTKLVWDANNKFYNIVLPKQEASPF